MKSINAYCNVVGHTGLAIQAREFFSALNKLIPVCLIPKFGPLPNEGEIFEMMQRLYEIDLNTVAINLDIPEQMYRFGGKYRIGYAIFESDPVNPNGVHQLKQLDQVWVPSQWAKNCLVQQGVDRKLIQIVHEGYNPNIYKMSLPVIPEIANIPGYKFLTISKWEYRKGVIELLKAFDLAFNKDDNVFLIARFSTNVNVLSHVSVEDEINKLNLKNRNKIILIKDELSPAIMPHLYGSCQAYVSATKAEGWGLPLLEAMASGLPVLAPHYSGQSEFLHEDYSYPVATNGFEDIYCPYFYPDKNDYGRWAKISVEDLATSMRYLYEHQEEAKNKGIQAARVALNHWTWDHAAKQALDCLKLFL